MGWNFHFVVMSVALQIILLWYYRVRRNLPILQNKLFGHVLLCLIATSVVNITATALDGATVFVSEYLLVLLNVVYYVCYALTAWTIFKYVVVYSHFWNTFNKYRVILAIPTVAFIIAAIATPFNAALFYVDGNGYFQRGAYYFLLNYIVIIYSVLIMVTVAKDAHNHSARERVCMGMAFMLIILGATLNYFEPKILLMDPFVTCAVMIVFITMQNPEFNISQLTNCFNDKGFEGLVDQNYSFNTPQYLIGINIKNIDNCRSYYGSKAVSEGLKQASKWLEEAFDSSSLFYVNNETYVLVSDTQVDMDMFKSRVEERFSKTFVTKDLRMYFTVSPFVVDDVDVFASSTDLLGAISLMEQSKVNRRDDGYYHLDSMVYEALRFENMVQVIIDEHVNNQDIEVFFQPIVSATTQTMLGVEALCRLRDDELGYISPGVFIPLAERSGAILPLSLIVFERICQYASTHDLDALGITFINVNISPVQCQDINLVDKYFNIASKYNLDFSLFDFEITESCEDESLLFETLLPAFVDRGASVSLDDFGTGRSGIKRLVSCPINLAKVDMSLVWDYFNGKNDILLHSISLFKSQGLEIIAEGVEDANMAAKLSELGCDYLQGYYFGRPLSFKDFDNLYN